MGGLVGDGADRLAGALACPATQTAATSLGVLAFVLAVDVTFRTASDLDALVRLGVVVGVSFDLYSSGRFDQPNHGSPVPCSNCHCRTDRVHRLGVGSSQFYDRIWNRLH